jgi:hypothetical protein
MITGREPVHAIKFIKQISCHSINNAYGFGNSFCLNKENDSYMTLPADGRRL